jgi:long-subunit acyl-CoA synthetase (AMP-forming)
LELASANKFNSLEKPKRIHLCPQEFVKENPDMITTTFKMKRSTGAKHFQNEIKRMYKN